MPLPDVSRLPVRHLGPGYVLLQGDCRELMQELPRGSVDLIFADPPYNLSRGGTTCQGGRRTSVDKAGWDASRGAQADLDWHRSWLHVARHTLAPSGTLWATGTHHVAFTMGFVMQWLGFHLLNTVTWFKPNASPNLACRFFTHSTELVLWAAPAHRDPLPHTFHYAAMKAANGGKQMRDVWELRADGEGDVWTLTPPTAGEKAEGRHPTQKPRALLERIIAASSSPGDLVLDPFNGSGTTGVEAVRAGRLYVGIDLDGEYLDLTERRLRALR